MNDRELLEFIAAQVGNLTEQVGGLSLKVDAIDKRLISVENTVTNIEYNHGQKFEALFEMEVLSNTPMIYGVI